MSESMSKPYWYVEEKRIFYLVLIFCCRNERKIVFFFIVPWWLNECSTWEKWNACRVRLINVFLLTQRFRKVWKFYMKCKSIHHDDESLSWNEHFKKMQLNALFDRSAFATIPQIYQYYLSQNYAINSIYHW